MAAPGLARSASVQYMGHPVMGRTATGSGTGGRIPQRVASLADRPVVVVVDSQTGLPVSVEFVLAWTNSQKLSQHHQHVMPPTQHHHNPYPVSPTLPSPISPNRQPQHHRPPPSPDDTHGLPDLPHPSWNPGRPNRNSYAGSVSSWTPNDEAGFVSSPPPDDDAWHEDDGDATPDDEMDGATLDTRGGPPAGRRSTLRTLVGDDSAATLATRADGTSAHHHHHHPHPPAFDPSIIDSASVSSSIQRSVHQAFVLRNDHTARWVSNVTSSSALVRALTVQDAGGAAPAPAAVRGAYPHHPAASSHDAWGRSQSMSARTGPGFAQAAAGHAMMARASSMGNSGVRVAPPATTGWPAPVASQHSLTSSASVTSSSAASITSVGGGGGGSATIPPRAASIQRSTEALLDEGAAAFACGLHDEALARWTRARDAAVADRDLFLEARALSNVAVGLRHRGRVGEALNALWDAWTATEEMVAEAAVENEVAARVAAAAAAAGSADGGEGKPLPETPPGEPRNPWVELAMKNVPMLRVVPRGTRVRRHMEEREASGGAGADRGPTSSSIFSGLSRTNTLRTKRSESSVLGSNGGTLHDVGGGGRAYHSLGRNGSLYEEPSWRSPGSLYESPMPQRSASGPGAPSVMRREGPDPVKGPPIVVWLLELTTNIGNTHYAAGEVKEAERWHAACLALAEATMEKYPILAPPSAAATTPSAVEDDTDAPEYYYPNPGSSFKILKPRRKKPASSVATPKPPTTLQQVRLSYLHRACLQAKSRALTHIALCSPQIHHPEMEARAGETAKRASHHTAATIAALLGTASAGGGGLAGAAATGAANRGAQMSRTSDQQRCLQASVAANSALAWAQCVSTHHTNAVELGNRSIGLHRALERLETAGRLFRAAGDEMGVARVEASLGALCVEVGRCVDGVRWAGRFAEAVGGGDAGAGASRGMGERVGKAGREAGPGRMWIEKGVKLLHIQVENLAGSKDWWALSAALANLGIAYTLLNQPHLALHFLSRIMDPVELEAYPSTLLASNSRVPGRSSRAPPAPPPTRIPPVFLQGVRVALWQALAALASTGSPPWYPAPATTGLPAPPTAEPVNALIRFVTGNELADAARVTLHGLDDLLIRPFKDRRVIRSMMWSSSARLAVDDEAFRVRMMRRCLDLDLRPPVPPGQLAATMAAQQQQQQQDAERQNGGEAGPAATPSHTLVLQSAAAQQQGASDPVVAVLVTASLLPKDLARLSTLDEATVEMNAGNKATSPSSASATSPPPVTAPPATVAQPLPLSVTEIDALRVTLSSPAVLCLAAEQLLRTARKDPAGVLQRVEEVRSLIRKACAEGTGGEALVLETPGQFVPETRADGTPVGTAEVAGVAGNLARAAAAIWAQRLGVCAACAGVLGEERNTGGGAAWLWNAPKVVYLGPSVGKSKQPPAAGGAPKPPEKEGAAPQPAAAPVVSTTAKFPCPHTPWKASVTV
ncbi:hypothetical protein HDU96_008150 [Phlyctochytrium bullatum]|nr:hypothetical protein HDU96_008150 [Phlyctochytrium bullatum]